MKTLFIVRHAKSSWDNPGLSDFDRPLNDRGKKDAPRMGKRLKEKNVVIDLMVTSPAVRALSTCKQIAEILSYPEGNILLEQKLYHATEDKMLDIVRRLNDQNDTAMIFGHNPGLTDFANSLVHGHISNIPTCGIVACGFSINSWRDVKWGAGKLIFYDYPKSKTD